MYISFLQALYLILFFHIFFPEIIEFKIHLK